MESYTGKIGIFGGTFDPVHYAHLFLAETAYEEAGLDRVLFMPSPDPYYRSDKIVSSYEKRMDMLRLATADNDHFEVSDFEIRLWQDTLRHTYTADTLSAFKAANPGCEIFFILGGDSVFSLESWKEPEKIFECASLISSPRSGQINGASGDCAPTGAAFGDPEEEFENHIQHLRDRYGARIMNVHFPLIDISSSAVLKRLREGKSVKYYLPDSVIKYINDNGLYL